MVNYLAKFIPTLSDLCHPLRQAISKEEWNWNQSCGKAITEIKEAILKTGVLRYLHPIAKITVQCDASSLALGAAILQEGKPVAFASRALPSAEKNYSQLEKEMLAIVFALWRFVQYVYGREVLVESDHQPLETILQKPLPSREMLVISRQIKKNGLRLLSSRLSGYRQKLDGQALIGRCDDLRRQAPSQTQRSPRWSSCW